ncbi:Hpt domain-containing protein [Stappia sp. 28M-7]|uniref:Hpt domain-containing protein n=1 Tax=Stappia sp. 28M-7 TaxID=2762596 RepID=UPI00163C3DB4|nr:Hpt domain-containing protein [Stappia sp. 28M-7]MBC2860366.1 Hpt domain-containing protein [Stappia sp. 28M-7]
MQATARHPDAASGHTDHASKADAPVDLVHLTRHTLGNRDLEREVLRLFAVQARMLVARMHEAPDEVALRRLLHTLLGSAKGIGAWGVAGAAERQQAALDDGGAADLPVLAGTVEEAETFIEQLLRD